MSLDDLFNRTHTVNAPTTEQETTVNCMSNQNTTKSALPKLKKNEKLDEIVKDINESIDKEKYKIGYLLYKTKTLNTPEMDYVIRRIDSNPLNIDFNHPINEKLQLIKSEIIRRVIEDRKNNPENFNKKLFHFFRLVLAKDEKIKRILTDKTIPEKYKKKLAKNIDKKISKNIKEINKRISTLNEKTLIYFENSYNSADCFPQSGIIRISHDCPDEINLIDSIGHELGHIILYHMIPKDKNRTRQFEELLCDTFAAYALSLFGKKTITPQPIEYSKEFTEQKNGKGCEVHPDDYTRNRIKNYILKDVDLKSAHKEIESIIGNIEEYHYTPKEKGLIDHIIKDEYEEAIKMLEEDPNIKIVSTPENIEKIIGFICNHGPYFSKEKNLLHNIEGDYWSENKELTLDKMLTNNPELLKNRNFLNILVCYLHTFKKRINITDENKDLFLNIINEGQYILFSFIKLDKFLTDATNNANKILATNNSNVSQHELLLNAIYNENKSLYDILHTRLYTQAEINKNCEENGENYELKDLLNYIDVTQQNVKKCFLYLEFYKNSPVYETLLNLFKDDQKILQDYINSHGITSSSKS